MVAPTVHAHLYISSRLKELLFHLLISPFNHLLVPTLQRNFPLLMKPFNLTPCLHQMQQLDIDLITMCLLTCATAFKRPDARPGTSPSTCVLITTVLPKRPQCDRYPSRRFTDRG